jgi:superfamily II DNA or RNA helicase
MKNNHWGAIHPEEVADVISFRRMSTENESCWVYSAQKDRQEMFDIQAEGVARIWNLLDTERIALLADEVGMGKTIQALSVCALLWRLHPDARILVLAPNKSVAENWVNEYKTFINSHLKESDNLVRTGIGMKPVHEPFLCTNLNSFEEAVLSRWCHFIIAKTSSFSTSSTDPKADQLLKLSSAYSRGIELNQTVIDTMGKGFDLLIIDEAQYFRRFDGDSLRVHTARGFFGSQPPEYLKTVEFGKQVADRVLLMTATPNHTCNEDVNNLVRYFREELSELDSQKILEHIGIRRLRRLSGKMKYQYRNEEEIECDFIDNALGELFFALYQRKLATEIPPCENERRSFTYGYLEGFESTPFIAMDIDSADSGIAEIMDREESEEAEGESDGGRQSEDFQHNNIDTEILQKLAGDFKRHFNNEYPVHPKYGAVTDRISVFPDDFWSGGRDTTNDKSLVFVRRIPSVRELAARMNRNYDTMFINRIYTAWGDEDRTDIPDRKEYNAYTASLLSSDEETEGDAVIIDDGDQEDEIDDGYSYPGLSSGVIELFRVKKDAKKNLQRTHASNFRVRFTRYNDPFSVFFLPPADYRQASYNGIYREKRGEKYIYLYELSCNYERLGEHHNCPDRSTILQHLQKDIDFSILERQHMELHTLWGIFYPLLEEEQRDRLDRMNIYQKEGLVRFLMKGILFASPCLIELYSWFIEVQMTGITRGDLYNAYVQKVRSEIENSLLFGTIVKSIDQYVIYTEKICGIFDPIELIDERWNIFNRQNPAYPCSGDTQNRQRLINAFNSPFFPNILVSTSVLQEGVNLQYNCCNVYHYGIAWTPGDSEQRVGRIDRLFSLIERKIQENSNEPTLNIFYPYLNNSFDRDQVAEFIQKKYDNEKTLDKCYIPRFDKVISDASSYTPYWKNYLRKPLEEVTVSDPYPADIMPEMGRHAFRYSEKVKKYPATEHLEGDLLEKIRRIVYGSYGRESVVMKTNELRTQIALIDVLPDGKRHQPVVAELNFSSELSGFIEGTVYYLTFRTPITSDERRIPEIETVYNRYNKPYSLVQLCHQKKADSQFTVYMRTDLPLFANKKGKRSNLVEIEIASMFHQLVELGDIIEKSVFRGNQDLTLSEVEKEEHYETRKLRFNKDIRTEHTESGKTLLIGTCKIYEKDIRREFIKTSALHLTHLFQFIKFRRTNKYLFLDLPYPDGDLDNNEEQLLKKWFEYVVSRVKSP